MVPSGDLVLELDGADVSQQLPFRLMLHAIPAPATALIEGFGSCLVGFQLPGLRGGY